MQRAHPRYGRPEDIVAAVWFLASDHSITVPTSNGDGGLASGGLLPVAVK